jgi:hypothetical protein
VGKASLAADVRELSSQRCIESAGRRDIDIGAAA